AGSTRPGRNAVAPPELAADDPVPDVPHPLEVGLAPALRHEDDAAVLHRLDGGLGQRLDLDEPLAGQPRLHHRSAALAVAERDLVRLRLDQQPLLLELRDDALAG